MTNDLAIRILTGDVLGTTEQTKEAVTMAVRALSKPNVTDTNVGDTISRQAAIDAIEQHKTAVLEGLELDEGIAYGYAAAHGHLVEIVKQLPSAERRGRWIDLQCDQCGQVDMSKPNYCPNCGAKMDEEENK